MMAMPSIDRHLELLSGVFYEDVYRPDGFLFAKSVFPEHWYNLIVPDVPPRELNWSHVDGLIDSEADSGRALSFYVPHALANDYGEFLTARTWNLIAVDAYVTKSLDGEGEHDDLIGRSQYEFRPVTEQNAEAFLDIGHRCFPEWPNQREYSRFSIDLARRLDDEGKAHDTSRKRNGNWLAYEGETPVAMGSMLWDTAPGEVAQDGYGYIHNTGVHPDHRRRGIFNELLDFLSYQALRNGVSTVYANTEYDGPAYHGFMKNGFHLTARYRQYAR
jgi:ribosomal protein S18 acetylase RimI-like enzyme